METEYGLFICLGFLASLVSAVFGLGTALIVLSLGVYILPVTLVMVLASVLFATSTVLKTLLLRTAISWPVALTFAAVSFPFAYLGALLVSTIPPLALRHSLGVMILVYVTLTHYSLLPKIKINTVGLFLGSATYGFVSGLLGSGNIIKAVLFREMQMSKEGFVGAMAATSILANIGKLIAFTQTGLLHLGLVWPVVGVMVAGVAAVFVGQRWLGRMGVGGFELGLRVVLLVSGLGLVFGA